MITQSPRGRGPAWIGGRIAALALPAVAVAALGAATLTPALAATPPSMTVNGNSVNIAIQGPNHSLKFYWAVNGTATWHAETVAGAGTTYSAPSMTVNGNAVNISAEGPNHKLKFYWAVNGTATWHAETVAGAGTTYSAPSMTVNGNAVNIAAQGAKNRLKFYWAVNGTATWHAETVAGDRHDVLGAVDDRERERGEHRGAGREEPAEVLLGG